MGMTTMSRFYYSKAYSIYGSSMGRNEHHGGNPVTRFRLQRVPVNEGGYDPGGAYWGKGMPLWQYEADNDEDDVITGFTRAMDREDAKLDVLRRYPTARFYR